MGFIRIDPDAARAMMKVAEAYGAENKRDAMEMGVALLVAGVGLLSVRTNNVQLDEIYEHVAGLASPLRKRNAS